MAGICGMVLAVICSMKMRPSDWDAFRYFEPGEFSHPDFMSRELLAKLEIARALARVPFVLTSTFRENDERSHGDGDAVDIACVSSSDRHAIISSLLIAGFVRIGIYPEHIHADVSRRLPQGVLFLGGYDG